jgi:hypothetical protein
VASAQSPLGSAQTFAVLGATTVTNTGPTVVTGDVGVSPGTAITGFLLSPANTIVGPGTVTAGPGLVIGTIRPGGPVSARAHGDAGVAYANFADMPCNFNLTGLVLGTDPGASSLGPGVYCFDSSAQLTGTLLLTGAGPWIFQIKSTLITANNAAVVVGSGAACTGSNVFWQVGSSSTLGARAKFVGNILALASITARTGATVTGSLMALTGAVTMDTNTVSVCAAGGVPPPPPMDKCEVHHHRHHHHYGDGDDKDHQYGDHDDNRYHHDRDNDSRDGDYRGRDNDRDYKD